MVVGGGHRGVTADGGGRGASGGGGGAPRRAAATASAWLGLPEWRAEARGGPEEAWAFRLSLRSRVAFSFRFGEGRSAITFTGWAESGPVSIPRGPYISERLSRSMIHWSLEICPSLILVHEPKNQFHPVS